MNRVVVTGLGIISPIGNNKEEVLSSLWHGRSGIVHIPEMLDLGFKCCLYGPVKEPDISSVHNKSRHTMSEVAQYAVLATLEAMDDARLAPEVLQTERAGVVVGTGLSGISEVARVEQMTMKGAKLSRAGATGPVKIMNSSAAGNLAAYFKVNGRVRSVSTACCTGVDNIGHAFNLLQFGAIDICIAGSAEEDSWRHVGAFFDNSGEMPRAANHRPSQACRPYDKDRKGFVLSSGAGILILETLEHAGRRGAKPYGEIVGYGSANDGADMFRPTGEGLREAISQSLDAASAHGVKDIDYINPHGTGTYIGDMVETEVIREVLGKRPFVSSTKGLTGHALGAAGAVEAVFTLLMMAKNFVAHTANLDNIAQECSGIRHVQNRQERPVNTAMAFNSGLGGTNACLVFKKM